MKKKFICSVCGYVYEGDAAPEACPLCKAPASKFTEMADSGEVSFATVHTLGAARNEGATAEKIKSAVETAPGYEEGRPGILMVDGFKEAVEAARDLAEEGDIVLMSPACASFDRFKNFAERGEVFKQIVNEW